MKSPSSVPSMVLLPSSPTMLMFDLVVVTGQGCLTVGGLHFASRDAAAE
jgi:hypothetical protein